MKALRHAIQGERCLAKGTLGSSEHADFGGGSVLRMKRMSQSVHNSRSLQLQATDEAETGAGDRPLVPAELHISSHRRSHLLARSSLRRFGRATSESRASGRIMLHNLMGRCLGMTKDMRVFMLHCKALGQNCGQTSIK